MSNNYNSKLYKFGKNFECFRNDQCWSGFCSNHKCSDPQGVYDSCRPGAKNCPIGLKCSEYSRTCVSKSYFKSSTGKCFGISDCRFDEYCRAGQCIPNRPIGSTCSSVTSDLCAMGSKCTVAYSISETTKCYELCSKEVDCPHGYKCIKNVFNPDSICVPKVTAKKSPQVQEFDIDEIFYGGVLIITGIMLLLLLIYGWIKFTNRGNDNDPRFTNPSSGKKRKKKLRLNYTGNGLATITVIPSNCQSPRPVAASDLFTPTNPYNINITYPDAPPKYSEVVLIQ